jgi:hypothetical protein
MKEDLGQKKFMEDLFMFVAKGYVPIFVVENQWLRHMVLCQKPQIVFPNWKQITQHAILELVAKTTKKIVMLVLKSCITIKISFDLWMSTSRHDTFALAINFINSHWVFAM